METEKCPVCGTSVKKENLKGHLERLHSKRAGSVAERQPVVKSVSVFRSHRKRNVAILALSALVVIGVSVAAASYDRGVHWHSHLSVTLNGSAFTVPANIGIDSSLWKDHSLDQYGSGAAALHTHDTSGTIHVEVITSRRDFTLHEFLAICNANGHMVRRFDNSLCRTASQVRCHQCFPERSPEDFFVRKLWLQSHLGAIDAFTCPSRFMLDHYADWGLARDKLFHVTNGQRDYAAADNQPIQARQEARETYNRFGFFGQIIDAKGVHIILRAVALLRAEGFTDFAIEINGGNLNYASPEVRAEIEEFIEAEKERPVGERLVWFNGSYATRELRSRMARIDWCLVPSMWWEAFALVISEAWMFKKPVICSNIGAMADRVRDEKDGLQFEMGDPAGLARTIKRAATEPGLWQRLAGALPTPPARADMIDGFRRIYAIQAEEAEPAAVDSHFIADNSSFANPTAHEKVPNTRRARTRPHPCPTSPGPGVPRRPMR